MWQTLCPTAETKGPAVPLVRSSCRSADCPGCHHPAPPEDTLSDYGALTVSTESQSLRRYTAGVKATKATLTSSLLCDLPEYDSHSTRAPERPLSALGAAVATQGWPGLGARGGRGPRGLRMPAEKPPAP